jgi:peptide-methionine (S)-S-oxide reductase
MKKSLTLLCAALISFAAGAAEPVHAIPVPAVDETPGPATTETVVLAGGCFWGVQGVYQHVKGVTSAVSGYAGGAKRMAQYELVGSGMTGHAESVSVTFDPKQISYGKILQIYFSVVHDPTQLNRQGPDSGTQYRSAIFPANEEQAKVAQAYIDQLDKTGIFGQPIVTKIEPGQNFYPAEGYHQNFLIRNPTYPYIVYNDLPKVAALKKMYPDLYQAEPTRVMADAH